MRGRTVGSGWCGAPRDLLRALLSSRAAQAAPPAVCVRAAARVKAGELWMRGRVLGSGRCVVSGVGVVW